MSSDNPQNSGEKNLTHLAGFEILEKIGEGGMGAVYRAKQKSLERVVALKVLAPRFTADAAYVDSFRREAKSAARLQHANIIPVFDAGEVDGVFYYAMEFVRGETLFLWVQREGALPEKTVLEIALCAANALKHAWDKERLIHRDVKPENVMVDADGNVKVCDLGLAKNFGENTMLSLSGQAFGTPNYMSPEQARAERTVDCRSDIYALGMTMWFALTGQIPFHGATATLVMARQLTEQLPDPRQSTTEISAHAVRLLEKMLAKDVADRYQSWDDVLRDLRLVLDGKAPQCEALAPKKSTLAASTTSAQRLADLQARTQRNVAAAVSAASSNEIDQRQGTAATTPKSRAPLFIGISLVILLLLVGGAFLVRERLRQQFGSPDPSKVAVPDSKPPPSVPTQVPTPHSTTTSTTFVGTSPNESTAQQLLLATLVNAKVNPLVIDLGNGATLELALIPAGSFLMGSEKNTTAKPVHQVAITKPFYLGKTEVTQEQWQTVMGNNPSDFKGAQHPVEQINWNDCQQFLNKLNERNPRLLFRLPTEAEWEYAARAGSTGDFCFGNDEKLFGDFGWFVGNSSNTTHAVGEKKPNAWGLHDVHGNVWEWCADWYAPDYYASSPAQDPTGPANGTARVVKGGAFSYPTGACGFGYRNASNPIPTRNPNLYGMRVALNAPANATSPAQLAADLQNLIQQFPNTPAAQQARQLLASLQPPPNPNPTIPLSGPDAKLREQTIGTWQKLQKVMGVMVLATGVNVEFLENGKTKLSGLQTGEGVWKPEDGFIKMDGEIWKVTVPGKEMEMGGFLLKKNQPTETVAPANPNPPIQPSGTETTPPIAFAPQSTQTATPVNVGARELTIDLGDGVKLALVLIPVGEFMMGSENGEKPVHKVAITKAFYLGKYEVTQEQWQKVMGNNPSKAQKPKHPVETVSWEDCQGFIARLNQKMQAERSSYQFRLPTEAEWEYACRAGSTGDYNFGNDAGLLGDYAWVSTNAGGVSHPVGEKKPNAWGLYDMHGSIFEWCADWFEGNYYSSSPAQDPTGASSGTQRVLRGGSFNKNHGANTARSAFRGHEGFRSRYPDVGVRLVAVATGESVAAPKLDAPWENSLRMKFVPVKGTDVLFSIWETRVQDYAQLVKATGREWPKPDFEQGPTHPAVNLTWDDAKVFCKWLTEKERKEGKLTDKQEYRLPTDAEWSVIVGPAKYPWGNEWPPPKGVGNYSGELKVDDYPNTAPVGSFHANQFGLYDVGGNVWEWCEDRSNPSSSAPVMRGASWGFSGYNMLESSCRNKVAISYRGVWEGFRCVLVSPEDQKRADDQTRVDTERGNGALSATFKNLSQPKTAAEWEKMGGTLATVQVTHNAKAAAMTGVRVTKGTRVFVAAHPDDRWRLSGVHPWHDFRGPIVMYYRIGSTAAPIPETPFVAAEDGELALYAQIGVPAFPEGKIRAKILTSSREDEQRARLAQAFGEFQKQFLAALAARDYAGAEKLALAAAAKPELESLKDRADAFAAVAQQLDKFNTTLPATLAPLKGKEITVAGTTGKLDEVRNGNLEVEKKLGETGAAIVEVPIAKLSPDEIASLVLAAKPNDPETHLDLAWLYFVERKSAQATEQLNTAEKAGVDVKTIKQVMDWLRK